MRNKAKTFGGGTRFSRFAFLVICALFPVFGSQARDFRSAPENSRTQELVEQLKDLIHKMERDRRSDSAAMQRLRDLVRCCTMTFATAITREIRPGL
jgi:hypothetical protein